MFESGLASFQTVYNLCQKTLCNKLDWVTPIVNGIFSFWSIPNIPTRVTYLAALQTTINIAIPNRTVMSKWTGNEHNKFLFIHSSFFGEISELVKMLPIIISPKNLVAWIRNEGCQPYKKNASFNGCVKPHNIIRKSDSSEKKIFIDAVKSRR